MHTNQQAAPSVSAEKQRDAQQAAIRQAMADLEAAKAAAQEGTAAEEENPITDELIDALKATLKKQKAVKKAYIKADAENDERFLLIALDAEGADIEEIAAALTSDCADYASLPFDCVPASNIRAKELVNSEKPFYEKKRFGIF